MFETIIHNISSCEPNTIGLILGFIGAVIIAFFGLPPIGLLNEGMYVEIEITQKMKRSMRVSRVGLFLIAVAFILQLSAIEPAIK